MRNLGWAFTLVFPSLEGVNNPREFVIRAHKAGKQGVLHYVLGNRESVCGNMRFRTSFMTPEGRNTLIQDPYDESELIVTESILCAECEDAWKSRPKEEDDEVDNS